MSRSALWHQEKNLQRRQQEAEEAWEQAVEEGRNCRAKNLVPLWGPDDSFHFNPMLLENIKKSPYFVKICREIKDWSALVDEIYYKVDHMEPWAIGGVKTPSTGFCLLLRLLTLRCTSNQMTLLLEHPDSPYIRAIGFLYLRYACDPTVVFQWIEPYLYDDEPIQIEAGKKSQRDGSITDSTIGGFVRKIFSTREYYGTMLPRLPVHIDRDIQVQLLQAEKVQKRAASHFRNKRTMEHFQKLGSEVMATFEDEENPLTWYKAVVDRVIFRGEDGSLLKHPKFIVTFTEYGNTETVTLGEMDMPDGHFHEEDLGLVTTGRGYDEDRGHDGRRDGKRKELYEEVRRRERDTITSSRRDKFHTRPPTAKKMLSSEGAGIRRSPSSERRRSPSPYHVQRNRSAPAQARGAANTSSKEGPRKQSPPPRKRTAEELAAIQEKKRKLLAKYG